MIRRDLGFTTAALHALSAMIRYLIPIIHSKMCMIVFMYCEHGMPVLFVTWLETVRRGMTNRCGRITKFVLLLLLM